MQQLEDLLDTVELGSALLDGLKEKGWLNIAVFSFFSSVISLSHCGIWLHVKYSLKMFGLRGYDVLLIVEIHVKYCFGLWMVL